MKEDTKNAALTTKAAALKQRQELEVQIKLFSLERLGIERTNAMVHVEYIECDVCIRRDGMFRKYVSVSAQRAK